MRTILLFSFFFSLLFCLTEQAPFTSTSKDRSKNQAKKLRGSYDNFPPKPVAGTPYAPTYPVVFVRVPRRGDNAEVIWSEAINASTLMEPGADMCRLNTDGSIDVLVKGGIDAVADLFVEFDGKSVLYARYYGDPSPTATDHRAGVKGADIFRYDVASGASTQLTNGGYFPNRAADDNLKWVVCNGQPCPSPDGKIIFSSNRNRIAPVRTGVRTCMQLYRMDADGSNQEKIGHLNLAGALHPMPLTRGEIAFSTEESQSMRDSRSWSFWTVFPDGSNFMPLFPQLTDDKVLHFGTQLSNGRIVAQGYYNQNDDGMGPLMSFNEPSPTGGPPSASAWTVPGFGQFPSLDTNISFRPMGFQYLTPWSTSFDGQAALSDPSDSNSPRVGKLTHPCGAPNNHLLASWSPGPVNHDLGFKAPSAHNQIVLIANGAPTSKPSDMFTVLADAPTETMGYNYIWPRPLVSYQQVFNMPQPVIPPMPANDGKTDPNLPIGTPFALIGTSSLYKRESATNGAVWKTTGTTVPGASFGLQPFYGANPTVYQGGDLGSIFSNEDIDAIEIVVMEPRTDYTPNGPWFSNIQQERLRSLGRIKVRKFDSQGNPLLDPDGNADTSFMALIPGDIPFTFAYLNKDGQRLGIAMTWHQCRPGEKKINCGGCHAHSQVGTDFYATAAGQPGYKVTDLTNVQPISPEFYKDIKPLLNQSCVPCHNLQASPIPGNLAFDDYTVGKGTKWPNVFRTLAGNDNSYVGPPGTGIKLLQAAGMNSSRYVRKCSSIMSLLDWRVRGKRTDGRLDSDRPTETKPGDATTLPVGATIAQADVDLVSPANQFSQCPPPGNALNIPPLTDSQKLTIAMWIDNGCPIDMDAGSGNGWFQDEVPPTLTIQSPVSKQSNPITVLRFGLHDYYSGLDTTSISVTSSVAIDGNAAGTNLASLFTATNSVYTYTLKTPLTGKGVLTISAQDKTGNRVKMVRSFLSDPAYGPPVSPPAPVWQPLPEFLIPNFDVPYQKQANPLGWAGWVYNGTSGTTRGLGAYINGTGSVTQSLIFGAGSYTISFTAAQNAKDKQTIAVTVDGQLVDTITPTGIQGGGFSTWSTHTTAQFTIKTTDYHTVAFTGGVISNTAYLKGVSATQIQAVVPTVPPVPVGLSAAANQIVVAWNAVDTATSYNVQRSADNGSTWTLLVNGLRATNYTDSNILPGTTYSYQVQAVNDQGASPWSGSVVLTPAIAAQPVSASKKKK